MSDVYTRIYEVVKRIPKGTAVTYGWVAKKAHTGARVVGQALHRNPDPQHIPCHRVVNAKGEVSDHFAFGGRKAQIKRLNQEGVSLNNGRVQLKN